MKSASLRPSTILVAALGLLVSACVGGGGGGAGGVYVPPVDSGAAGQDGAVGGGQDAGSTSGAGDAGGTSGGVSDAGGAPDAGGTNDAGGGTSSGASDAAGTTDGGAWDSGAWDSGGGTSGGTTDSGGWDSGSSGGGSDGGGSSGGDAAPTGSCVGKCGKYTSGASCQCDDKCAEYKDCCPDLKQVCGGSSSGGGGCKLPTSFSSSSQRVTKLAMLGTKEGCDLTGNGQINNVLGGLLSLAATINSDLQKSVDDGDLVLMFVPDKWSASGANMQIDGLNGGKDGQGYYADKDSWLTKSSAAMCPAKSSFDKATVKFSKLDATSSKPLVLSLSLVGGPMDLPLNKVQLKATVSGPSSWVSSKSGLLCGALAKTDLDKAIDAVPDADFKQLGLDKATVKMLLAGILKPDIDVDGDGSAESISAAFSFETPKVAITGIK